MIHPRPQVIALVLLSLWVVWLPRPSDAGEIKISPIRVDLSAAKPIGVLTVANPSDEPILLHLRLKQWSHRHGPDQFQDSRDVLLNPMIFELDPGEEQVVRIGLTHPLREERESSFRLFIQEVPDSSQPKTQNVATQLKVSLPVFVAPRDPVPPDLDWRLIRRSATELALRVVNRGNLHGEIYSIAVLQSNGEPFAFVDQRSYVLPGQSREWVLPAGSVTEEDLLTLTANMREGGVETVLRLGTPSAIEEALR